MMAEMTTSEIASSVAIPALNCCGVNMAGCVPPADCQQLLAMHPSHSPRFRPMPKLSPYILLGPAAGSGAQAWWLATNDRQLTVLGAFRWPGNWAEMPGCRNSTNGLGGPRGSWDDALALVPLAKVPWLCNGL